MKELGNIELILKSAPQQLSKENNKFVFSHVKESARAKDLEASLAWLLDAGLIHQVQKVEHPLLPLSSQADASFYKIYLSDVGLLSRTAGFTQLSLQGKSCLTAGFRGSLTENFALTELLHLGLRPYFWRSRNTAEVDFLIEQAANVIPIEAKAEQNTQAKSYKQFIQKYKPKQSLKLSLKNIAIQKDSKTEQVNLPLYLTWNLGRYINQ